MRQLKKYGFCKSQVALEYVIALFGAVALIYIILNVWYWLNRTLAERQGMYNTSRLAAGQARTAGQPVGYQRPPISLLGSVNDPASYYNPGDPGSLPPPSQAPCDDALLLIRNTRKLQQETAFIGLKLSVVGLRMQYVGGVQQCLGNRIAGWDCADDDEDECDYANAQLDILRALTVDVLSPLQQQYQDRLSELAAEVQSVASQFGQVCQGGPAPTPYVMSPLVPGPMEAPCPAAQADYDAANALYDQALQLFYQMIDALDAGDDVTAATFPPQIRALLNDPSQPTDDAFKLYVRGSGQCDPNDRSPGGGCYVP